MSSEEESKVKSARVEMGDGSWDVELGAGCWLLGDGGGGGVVL